ncbi:hypothetical protein [Spirosoma telluris]|uniref:Uncharacterized protein n=1 Tax=Spirosoma telluris TaxID=2183553 RepID=A0A327NSL3_9BACT|nr:hypothetical protein HMF3257_31635 [Spirosoma telluris]
MLKVVICLILFGLSQKSLQAQSQLDWLMKQSDFRPILANHLKEAYNGYHAGFPNVSVVLFKPNGDSLTVYLDSYSYLIEAKDHLPASFTTISSQPFLIYDGSEVLIEDKNGWFEIVKAFVGKRLCDDLEYRELLKQPGPKELRVPCGIIYEPPIEKLIFKRGKLISRKIVVGVPYYLE